MCVITGALLLGSSAATASATTVALAGYAATAINVAMVAGTVMSGVASYQGTKAQNQMNKFQSKVAQRNADFALAEGEDAEKEHRKDLARIKAEQRVNNGGSAVDVGSNLDMLEDTAYEGELDALALRRNAGRKAWGYDADSSAYKSMKQSPVMNAGASLISGTTQMTGMYLSSRR